MEFFGLKVALWITSILAVVAIAGLFWYKIKISNLLRNLVLPILHKHRSLVSMNVAEIIQILEKSGLYPAHTPMFFIKHACEAGIKKGWIVRRGYTAYQISAKGRTEVDLTLDQDDWRKRKKKFPA